MKPTFDVITLSELLIDFTPAGTSEAGMALYERNAGGGPPNSLVAIARQGGKPAFIGKVGQDGFGHFLEQSLKEYGVDTTGLLYDPVLRTTLAVVSLDETGDREFFFYRNPSADLNITAQEVDPGLLDQAALFHFSSLSLTHEPARSATKFCLEHAKKAGKPIGFDPNLRLLLWDSEEEARQVLREYVPYADILRIGKDEFEFLFGAEDLATAAPRVMKEYDITYLFITDGPQGATYYHRDISGHLPTYQVDVVDTTGSGDAFTGTVIYELSKLSPEEFRHQNKEALERITKLANACGSLAATKKGGIPSMPTLEEMLHCVATCPPLLP